MYHMFNMPSDKNRAILKAAESSKDAPEETCATIWNFPPPPPE